MDILWGWFTVDPSVPSFMSLIFQAIFLSYVLRDQLPFPVSQLHLPLSTILDIPTRVLEAAPTALAFERPSLSSLSATFASNALLAYDQLNYQPGRKFDAKLQTYSKLAETLLGKPSTSGCEQKLGGRSRPDKKHLVADSDTAGRLRMPLPEHPYKHATQFTKSHLVEVNAMIYCSSFPLHRGKADAGYSNADVCKQFHPLYQDKKIEHAKTGMSLLLSLHSEHVLCKHDSGTILFGFRMPWTDPPNWTGPLEDPIDEKLKILLYSANLYMLVKKAIKDHEAHYRPLVEEYVHPEITFAGYGRGGMLATWMAYRYICSGHIRNNSLNLVKVATWAETKFHPAVPSEDGRMKILTPFAQLHALLGNENHLRWTTDVSEGLLDANFKETSPSGRFCFMHAGGVPIAMPAALYRTTFKDTDPRAFSLEILAEYPLSPWHTHAMKICETFEVKKAIGRALKKRDIAVQVIQEKRHAESTSNYQPFSRYMTYPYFVPSPFAFVTMRLVEELSDPSVPWDLHTDQLQAHIRHLDVFYKLCFSQYEDGIEAALSREAVQWVKILKDGLQTVFSEAYVSCKLLGPVGKDYFTIPKSDEIYDFKRRTWRARCDVAYAKGTWKATPYLGDKSVDLQMRFFGGRSQALLRSELKESIEAPTQSTAPSADTSPSTAKVPVLTDGLARCYTAIASKREPAWLSNIVDTENLALLEESIPHPFSDLTDTAFYWSSSKRTASAMHTMRHKNPAIFAAAFLENVSYLPECSEMAPHDLPLRLRTDLAIPAESSDEHASGQRGKSFLYYRQVALRYFINQLDKSPRPSSSSRSKWLIIRMASSIFSRFSRPIPSDSLAPPQSESEVAYEIAPMPISTTKILNHPTLLRQIVNSLYTQPSLAYTRDCTHPLNRWLQHAAPAFLRSPEFDRISSNILLIPNTSWALSIVPSAWLPGFDLSARFVQAAAGEQFAVFNAAPASAGPLAPQLYWWSFQMYFFQLPSGSA